MPEDPFGLDEPDETDEDDQGGSASESQNIKEIRAAERRARKELKEAQAELAGFRAEKRRTTVTAALQEAGVSRKADARAIYAELGDREPSAELIKQLATELEVDLETSAPPADAATPPVEDKPKGFTPVVPGSSDPGTLGKVTLEEAVKLPVEEQAKLKAEDRIEHEYERDENGSPAVDWLAGFQVPR